MSEVKWKKRYYSNGKLHFKMPYIKNKRHGIHKTYRNNSGELSYEIPYVEDERHGIVKRYDENGESHYVNYYLYGSIVTKEEYRKHQLIEKLSGL